MFVSIIISTTGMRSGRKCSWLSLLFHNLSTIVVNLIYITTNNIFTIRKLTLFLLSCFSHNVSVVSILLKTSTMFVCIEKVHTRCNLAPVNHSCCFITVRVIQLVCRAERWRRRHGLGLVALTVRKIVKAMTAHNVLLKYIVTELYCGLHLL